MYLGQEPTVGSYDLVTVSEAFNGSRTAFTMSKSVASANQLMIILSGVTQHWGEAFTVSGTTLTFTSAPPTGSTIRILDFGRHVLDVGTPTDGTITTAKLADDAVTIAKLAATGTASGSTFLRGDNTWGAISSTSITDADNNTKIQVEESSDENKIRFDTAGTERMIIDAAGSVGIGTSSPGRQLELKGSSDNAPLVIDTAAGAHAGIWLKENGTDRWQVYSEASSGDLSFFNYGTSDESMRIEANGELNMKYDIVFGAAGKGICLGVTSNTDANTLDDYEEGTFTPTIQGQTGASGQSYSNQFGAYTKVGRLVALHGYVTLSNKGTINGNYIALGGFPFANMGSGADGGHCGVSRVEKMAVSSGYIGPDFQFSGGASLVIAMEHPANGGTSSGHRALNNDYGTPTDAIANDTSIAYSCTYMTA